ncbi:MAG: hypothetical protein QM703_20800 [Gemmatales bacterium]
MHRRQHLLYLLIFSLLLVGGFRPGSDNEPNLYSQEFRPPPRQAIPPSNYPPNVVRQGFPAAAFDSTQPEQSDSAWEIEWELTHPLNRVYYPPGSVMRIKSAKFMYKDKDSKPRWITVVRMLEVSEIYVPYDNGDTAFLDVHDMPFNMTPARKSFLGPNCVAPGEVLGSTNPAWANTLHKEVHDDGVRWMSAETSGRNEIADRVRRGEKLILWGTYYGANYRYMMEYSFTDDGQIHCRVGPTGRNIFSRQKDQGDTHLHIGCWRMEMDLGDPYSKLGGPKDNDVVVSRRVLDEQKEKFTQVVKPFNKNGNGDATEGSLRWQPEDFTTLRVVSRVRKNSHGHNVAYDIISHRFGANRQLQPEGGSYDEDLNFVNQDFWVTRSESGFTDFINVPKYAKDKRPLRGQATTIWLSAPALHAARTEDFGTENGANPYNGVAITTWTGFTIKPRDLFDGTPLYSPTRRTGR